MNTVVDYILGSPVLIPFTTNSKQGGAIDPSSPFDANDVKIYKGLDNTGKLTTNGVFMISPWHGFAGAHILIIDTSNNTGDDGFWAAGEVYNVLLNPDDTVDGETVIKWIGSIRLNYMASVNVDYAAIWSYAIRTLTSLPSATRVRVISPITENGEDLDIVVGDAYNDDNGMSLLFDLEGMNSIAGLPITLGIGPSDDVALLSIVGEIVTSGGSTQRVKFQLSALETQLLTAGEVYGYNIQVGFGTLGASPYSPVRGICNAKRKWT